MRPCCRGHCPPTWPNHGPTPLSPPPHPQVLAEALLAPAIPSVAARAGGLFLPLAKALCLACGSDPANGTEGKMGSYLMMTCFLGTTVSSGGWGRVGLVWWRVEGGWRGGGCCMIATCCLTSTPQPCPQAGWELLPLHGLGLGGVVGGEGASGLGGGGGDSGGQGRIGSLDGRRCCCCWQGRCTPGC